MGEILNKEEIETLLSAVSSGKISTEKTKKIFKKTIIPYDFRKTNIAPRDQIRFLETIYQNFVRVYATSLGDFLKTIVELKLAKVEQIDFIEFISSLSSPTHINILGLDPLKGKGILEIDSSLAFSIIDRLLGGPGKALENPRELTNFEYSILKRVVLITLDCLKKVWEPVFPLTFKIQGRETNPQFAQITGTEETVIVTSIEGKIGESSGLITLCIPYLVIKPVLSKLTSGHQTFKSHEPSEEKRNKLMEKIMGEIKVDIIAELGISKISIGEFLQLEVGDVISLNQNIHKNIIIKIEDSPKFFAIPGVLENKIAAQITSILSD